MFVVAWDYVRLAGHARMFAVEGISRGAREVNVAWIYVLRRLGEPERDLTKSSLSSYSLLSSSQKNKHKKHFKFVGAFTITVLEHFESMSLNLWGRDEVYLVCKHSTTAHSIYLMRRS